MSPLSRSARSRSALAVTAGLSLALALSACGGSDADSSGSPDTDSGAAVAGGTLRFAINSETNCLDPHQSPADVAGFFSRPIVDSLVALSADGKISPWLATAWTVSPDQKTYELTLRNDVVFSNGEKFDGEAVKANLDHIVNKTTKSQLAAGTISAYTGTDVIDPTHVRVNFNAPSAAFLATAATAYLGLEAPSTLKQAPEQLCKKIVGTGPFTSEQGYVPQKGISYVKNPAYAWGPGNAKHQGAAYLDGIDISVVPEDSSRYGALTSGQVDAIASVPPVSVAQLTKTSGFAVQTAQAPGGNYSYYPNTAKGVFTDVRVREAFRAGIDWATIVDKLYFGVYQPGKGPLSPSTVANDTTVAPSYSYDKAKAEKLLDEAGWTARDSAGYRTKDGKRLTLVHPFLKAFVREQRDVVADQVQAAAKQLGIEFENRSVDLAGYFDVVGTGNYDLGDLSWQRAEPDALRTLFSRANIATPGGFGTNQSRYDNPQVEQWLTDALAATSPADRAAIYAKVQQQITQDAAVFPVYVFNYVLGRTAKLKDVTFEPQAFPIFYDAWLAS